MRIDIETSLCPAAEKRRVKIYNDVIDWTVKALATKAGSQMGRLLLARIANRPVRELQVVHQSKLQFVED
jgi:hypothetical protein